MLEIFLYLMPAGDLFYPILYESLDAMGFVESQRLKQVQLDSQTTGLINYMRNTAGFNESMISITGHSLGGGIALITGAQTNIPAIAISGTTMDTFVEYANYTTNQVTALSSQSIYPKFICLSQVQTMFFLGTPSILPLI